MRKMAGIGRSYENSACFGNLNESRTLKPSPKTVLYNWGMRSQMEASAVCHSIFSGDKRSNSPTPPKHQGWDRTMKYHSDKAYEDQNQYKRPNTAWGQMTNTIANSVRSSVPQGPLFQSPDVEKPLFQDASKKQPYAKPPGFGFFKL